MTSKNYAYYSFPPTPTRATPSPSSSRRSINSERHQSQDFTPLPHTPPRQIRRNWDSATDDDDDFTMASSPATGKQALGSASQTPSTPTKGARKPISTPQQKPGQQSVARNTPSAPKGTPSTPKTGPTKKPIPSASKAQNVTGKAQNSPAQQAKNSAQNAPKQASQTAQKASNQATSAAGNGDDDGPLSKASQAKNGLQEAAPEPVQDDDDDENDTAGNVQNQAEDAAEQANDTANEAADNASNQAKQLGGKATDQANQLGNKASQSAQQASQQPQQRNTGGGLLKGAQGLAGKASGLAGRAPGKATDKAQKATQDPAGAAQETANDAQDAAGDAKGGVEETAAGAQDDAQQGLDQAKDAAGDAAQQGSDAVEGAKDSAQDAVNGVKDSAQDTAEGVQDTAEDAAEGAQETAGDAAEGAQDAAEGAAENVQDTAEDAAEGAQDTAEDAAEGVQDAADDAQDAAEDAAGEAQDTAEDAAGDAQDTAEDAAGQAQDTAEDGAGDGLPQPDNITKQLPQPPEGLPLDLSVLNGLEVQQDGTVFDNEGNAIGKLAEGDAEDLEGYPIGDNGEILDDDGDLVGRVELLPEEIKKQISTAREQGTELPEGADDYLEQLDEIEGQAEDAVEDGPQLPGLNILNGLSCQIDGLVYDDDGNTVGKVVDGDPEQLQNATLNEQGEFIDEEGNVVGYAEIHEEAADLVEQGVYEAAGQAEDAQDQVEDAAEDAQDQAEDAEGELEGAADEAGDAVDEAAEGIEDQLPGIEALEGRELNEVGDIVDDGGNLLGAIEDEELKQKIADGEIDPNTLSINEAGEVVDEDGNVLGKTELAEGAAERLAGGPLLDLRILDGKKISKKGQIFDEEGDVIGELRDGELSDCAGKKVSEKGEVYDKDGNLVGHVNVVSGEAAENATRDLLEELGELQPAEGEEGEEGQEEAEDTGLPDLSTLDGLKVNKKGQILNEDGEPIGELIEGELADCTGKKVNDSGEVLDKDGNVIGRVQTLAPETEDEQQEIQDTEEEEDEGDQLPPLSILEGLTCNKAGKLIDDNGNVVGELTEGDAKKLSKSGSTCDDQGQFWDNKGHVIGRAQTLPQEDAEEEAPFAGLEGLHVVDDGYVEDDNGNRVGAVSEGDWKKLLGRVVDEDGDVLDKKGTVVGHADRYEQPEEEAPAEADLSFLQGKTVNKAGMVIGDEGVPVAQLVEGKAKELAGKKLDDQGQLWNDRGQVIGRVELIPEEDREAKPEGPFAGLEDLRVIEGGKVADESGNVVGELVEGNAKRLVGLSVDEDGDVMDRYGNVKGHAEPIPEEEEQEVDNSILSGKSLNKQGYVVDENGVPFGRLIEGYAKELAGRRCDENGLIYNDTGKAVGRCEVIPENERVARPEGPFAGLEGLRVVKEGWVEDEDGNRVGQLVEGNAKRLVGLAVDEDGDIIDKYGNVKGHAEPWEEEEVEEEQEDLSALNGCTINKNGNAVDNSGAIIGRIAEGDVKSLVGKKVDGQGQIWDNAGNVVGRCELVYGEDTSPEGPFAGFEGLQIQKDGTVTTASGDIIGRIIEGDVKKLMGHTVDEDGDIVDKNGNSIGKAERWEPEEKERRVNPMSGHRVNKEGEVRDDNGDLIGRLTDGSLGHCVGQEIDDSGNVVDVDGNKIGECTLIENIAEDEYEGPSEEELEEARKREEERQIAEKMSGICSQTLERVQPVCKQITEHMEKADRTPKEELDEEQLVNDVKPLIEEGGRILQECNGSLRGLDPDGKIAAQAKGRAGTGEATPEEYRLAETLKELTTTVVTTIDNAKKRLNDMPHAKKKLNPLWSLLTQPLFQILAAVGLLLAGVLGLVGQLLNGLGLGGLVNGLMGGLGINKLMESFGLGGGDDKKKGGKSGGSALSNLPVVGGLLGGK